MKMAAAMFVETLVGLPEMTRLKHEIREGGKICRIFNHDVRRVLRHKLIFVALHMKRSMLSEIYIFMSNCDWIILLSHFQTLKTCDMSPSSFRLRLSAPFVHSWLASVLVTRMSACLIISTI